MDRLSFVGEGALGALSYLPISELQNNNAEEALQGCYQELLPEAFVEIAE